MANFARKIVHSTTFKLGIQLFHNNRVTFKCYLNNYNYLSLYLDFGARTCKSV